MKHHIMVAITAVGLICLSSAAWCCADSRLDRQYMLSPRSHAKTPLESALAATGEAKFIQVADGGHEVSGFQAQEKRRVPKKDEDKDDDDSGMLDALSDCLDMLNFLSELSEVCGGDDDEGEQAETDEVPIIEWPEEWLHYQGVVNPIDPAVEEVEIWTVAGGPGNGGDVVRVAPRGMRLRVMGRSYSLNEYWLYVGPAERDEVYGWIWERYVVEASESGAEE